MHFIMYLIVLIYSAAVFGVVKMIYSHLVSVCEEDVLKEKIVCQGFIEKKGNVYFERNQLREESDELFTLYEMTKEITTKFNEQDAFAVFQKELKENVECEESHLLEPDSPELEELKVRDDYFLFPLKGKEKLLGYLVLRGVALGDKEKIMILAHQFALALQRIKLYQEIETLAITDSLTDVYTRRYIMERFEEELERSKTRNIPLSFLMIDVDYFKRYNDRYGHLTGDRILQEISDVIRDSIRGIDIIGRYGGEEFCVVLPETARNGALYVAERIRSSVEKVPIHAYETTVRATVSVGIVTFPEDSQKLTGLIDKADWALYRAKKQGRNTVCVFGVYE